MGVSMTSITYIMGEVWVWWIGWVDASKELQSTVQHPAGN